MLIQYNTHPFWGRTSTIQIDLVTVLAKSFFQLYFSAEQISWVRKIGNSKLCKLLCCCSNYSLSKLHCLFCLMHSLQSYHVNFFLQMFVSNESALAYPTLVERTCCLNVVNSKVGKHTKRCEIVIHKYAIIKSWR